MPAGSRRPAVSGVLGVALLAPFFSLPSVHAQPSAGGSRPIPDRSERSEPHAREPDGSDAHAAAGESPWTVEAGAAVLGGYDSNPTLSPEPEQRPVTPPVFVPAAETEEQPAGSGVLGGELDASVYSNRAWWVGAGLDLDGFAYDFDDTSMQAALRAEGGYAGESTASLLALRGGRYQRRRRTRTSGDDDGCYEPVARGLAGRRAAVPDIRLPGKPPQGVGRRIPPVPVHGRTANRHMSLPRGRSG